jgi:diguanylate cyclase (GGDEF)-like protein
MPVLSIVAGQAPSAINEAERLKALSRFEFLFDEPNPVLDEICLLAKNLFGVSYAGVGLVGEQEIVLLTPEPDAPPRIPRWASFSGWAILSDEVLVVDDPLLVQNRSWSASPARFYAGAPLAVSPGVNVGVFCIRDVNPCSFTDADESQLRRLGNLAMNELLRQRSLLDLEHREILLSQASRMAKVGSWDIDLRTGVTTWSEQTYEILDHPRDRPPITPDEFLARVAPHDQERMKFALDHPADTDADWLSVEILRPNGESRWVNFITETHTTDGEVDRAFGSLQDVTELHRSHAEVERLAFRDSLTGLPNRTLFNSQFEKAIQRARKNGTKVGLIMLDLDHFKDVNDTLGHDAGDVLLCSVAQLLTRSYRSTDTVARLGGDEFAIILPDISRREDLIRPTEVLMNLLRHPVEHAGQIFTISASIGGALYPLDDEDAGQLRKNADIALYQAKAAGRNRLITYEPAMRAAVTKRIEMLREVRQGIADGAFVLYYQPVISIEPEVVTGFEALMRWNHPTRGVLTPDAFMEGFEDPDLAMLLFGVTFDGAFQQMRAWLEQGVEFGRVALNVSAAQFRTSDLAAQIEAKLRHWGVPPERLTIEVTENVYMGWGADVVGDTVRRLHDAGVLIALDDFGTGYASLTHLKQFPIDRLKIDKTFVQDTDNQAIVQAVINLGTSLGMKVVAEGVEEAGQLAFLARSGCDQVQGYHFAKPMPAIQIPAFLAKFALEQTEADARVA